jgi:enoyl-CoA hydratase/carnithine racemase
VSDISLRREGDHIAVVRLCRPPNNFFDSALISELADTYENLGASDWCRAIVLGSEGKHFCAGLDFSAAGPADIDELYRHALRLFAAPLPVVAAVQGAAIGGGCGLALSADFRVATAQSRFSTNFARLGFHHGFALSETLPRVVGVQHAADLLMTGRRVGGEEAKAIGLCDELSGEDDLLDRAVERAASIAAAGPLAVRSIRATLRLGLIDRLGRAMEREAAEQEKLGLTADFAEGVRASAERREPRFGGR